MKMNRGGARAGAGRKPLPEGEKVVSKSVSMRREVWSRIDEDRGNRSIGRYLEVKVCGEK